MVGELREGEADIGTVIRVLRRNKKLTQRELAERAGISKSALTLLESGQSNTRLTVLLKICAALDAEVVIRSTPSFRIQPPPADARRPPGRE
jgi:transcriptional regulator with XRE-family HTH domain